MKSREQAASFIDEQLSGISEKTQGNRWRYGLSELNDLMNYIYGDPFIDNAQDQTAKKSGL